ncbi:MAG: tol-pal system protein YbgF [Betaproteobacteria bacterium]|nr:MAG: tol-pal system protein YbgF [Betaproteobacteria bacterium]
MKLRAALLLGLCLVAGAARAGLFDDEEARKDIAALRVQVGANQKAAEERLARIETMLQDRSIELAKLIDELKQDLARMRGQIEVQSHQIETLDRRQKDLYVDLDTRLRKLEASIQAQEKQAASAPDPLAEGKAYEAALNQFKLGNYQSSVAAFQNFLATYPNSQQLSSAQYWIGNAYYALRDYKSAIAAQQKVLASWPDSAKAPDALLNIASCQAEIGEAKAARETLQALLKKYPGTQAAEQAKQRLAGKR